MVAASLSPFTKPTGIAWRPDVTAPIPERRGGHDLSDKYVPNLSIDEMQKILSEEEVGCLCTSLADEPYAVPVSYAWLDGRIVFHCALKGRKLDILAQNPNVCFVVDRHPDRTRPHHAEGTCTYRFESVLCFGTARLIKSPGQRLEWLRRFQAHFQERLGQSPEEDPITPSAAKKCGCVVIDVTRMTGRRKV